MLRAFAAHAFGQHVETTVSLATPAQANTASWRPLDRAGFNRRGTCRPPDEPPAFIYGIGASELS